MVRGDVVLNGLAWLIGSQLLRIDPFTLVRIMCSKQDNVGKYAHENSEEISENFLGFGTRLPGLVW